MLGSVVATTSCDSFLSFPVRNWHNIVKNVSQAGIFIFFSAKDLPFKILVLGLILMFW